MLYLEHPSDIFTAWRGEPIADIVYPAAIESLWSEQELAAIDLYSPVDSGIPEGKVSTGVTVQRLNGVVTMVYALEDAPPPPLPDLAPWQFRAMLRLSGKEDDLLAFLDNLPEPARTVAKAKLEYTLVFHRDNDLVLAVQQALGLSDQELDGLWAQAASL